MKKRYVFEKITDAYIKNIADINEQYTNLIHLLYREDEFTDEEVEWIFWKLEEMASRYGSYSIDKEKCLFHEEDIFNEAKKVKENYDTYK